MSEKTEPKMCKQCNARPCALYCDMEGLAVCAKCGANKHHGCGNLMDCADLVNATKEKIQKVINRLEAQPKPGEEKKEEEPKPAAAGVTLDGIEKLDKQAQDSFSEGKDRLEGMKTNVEGKVNAKVKEHREELNTCKTALKDLSDRVVLFSKGKSQMIEELKGQITRLDSNVEDKFFDAVCNNYIRCKDEDIDGSQGFDKKLIEAKALVNALNVSGKDEKTLIDKVASLFEKNAFDSRSEQTCDNFVFYLPSLSQELFLYNIESGTSKRIELFNASDCKPFIVPDGCDSVMIHGSIYIVGGTKDDAVTPLSEVYEYSFLRECVLARPSLNEARRDHTLQRCGDYIYAISGRNGDGITPTCERYRVTNPFGKVEEKWENIASLTEGRCSPSVCAFEDARNPRLFAICGFGAGGCVDKIETLLCNNPGSSQDTWAKIEIKTCEGWKPRYAAGAFLLDEKAMDKIVVFGGMDQEEFRNTFIIDMNTKKMEPCADLVEPSAFAQRKTAMKRDGSRVFIVGTFPVHFFNTKSKTWEEKKSDDWHPI